MNCDVSGVTAWFGPAIGPQKFEVGDDVWNCFVAQDWQMGRCFSAQDGQKFMADIYAIATIQLNELGVSKISGGDFALSPSPSDSSRIGVTVKPAAWRHSRG